VRQRPRRAVILIAALVAATMVASGCARTTSSIAPSGASPLADPSLAVPTAHAPGAATPLPDATFRTLTPEEQAAADAFAALADEHNRAVTELLIANPLAEWDLVGLPLADEVTALPDRLASLPAPPLTHDLVTELAIAVAAIGAALAAIDPHAPRVDQATAYAQALDDWVARVVPIDVALRARLGLPPPGSGDLRL